MLRVTFASTKAAQWNGEGLHEALIAGRGTNQLAQIDTQYAPYQQNAEARFARPWPRFLSGGHTVTTIIWR